MALRLIVAGLLVTGLTATAAAQPSASRTHPPVDPTTESEDSDDDMDVTERDMPNFDGRDDAPASARDVFIWIPRLAMFPLYLVSEFVLRRPLGYLVTNAEEAEIPDKVIQFFTFGPSNNIALAPTFSFDFGFRPNAGIYFRYNDFISKGHKLRAGASIAGRRWITGSLAYRWAPDDSPWEFQISGNATKRPDGLFFGISSEASESVRSRYNWVGYDANMSARTQLWRQSSLGISVGYRHRRFGERVGDNRTTIPDRVEQGRIEALPGGFEEGISAVVHRTHLTIDTRPSRPEPGTGLKVVGEYSLGFDANNPSSQMWVTYGGSVGGYIDVTGNQHVFGLQVSAALADGLSGEVPFTELPTLSNNGPMRGFVGSFLSGDSEFAVLLDYHWPVWGWLDGTLHVAVGNVYDGQFEDFRLENMRLSWGIGLAGVSQRDHFFEFLVGFGTDTFENRPDVESVRILFGGTREF